MQFLEDVFTMSQETPIVFIGSGEASVLERKTLIYSIKKNTPGPVEIVVFNGTHNTIEHEGAEPILAPLSLRAKYKNITEFSNYRFLIPALRGFKGRALYLDSDMVCIGDLRDIFNVPLHDNALLGKSFVTTAGDRRWGLSVALYDCARCHFDLDLYINEMDHGDYSYTDLQQMTLRFLKSHAFQIGEIDPNWNSYDHFDSKTKLIHYTNLHTQPWRVRGHRHGKVWFKYFREACQAGVITEDDIEKAIRRGYARQDIALGNTAGLTTIVKNAMIDLKAALRDLN